MIGKEKWISTYTNLHKKIYETENVTRMERIEVVCKFYKSKCFNKNEEEEENEERVENKQVEVDESEGKEVGDEDNEDEEQDNKECTFVDFYMKLVHDNEFFYYNLYYYIIFFYYHPYM